MPPMPTSPAFSTKSDSPSSRTLSQWQSFNPLYSSLTGAEVPCTLEAGELLLEEGERSATYRHRVCTLGRLSAAVVCACALVLVSLSAHSRRWSPLLWGRKSGEEASTLAGATEPLPPPAAPSIPPGNEGLHWCAQAAVKNFPTISPYSGSELKDVRVLTFNLFWWNLFGQRQGAGGIAGHLIRDSSKDVPFDFMGFQECEDVGLVLWQAGLDKAYTTNSSNHAICMAYRRDKWTQLDSGYEEIAEDRSAQYFGNRAVQWMRAQNKHQPDSFIFFMNHHGPLPVDSGGKCGGMATAWHLMNIVKTHAHPGDAIILVGDFNAGDSSVTVLELEKHLYRAYSGVAFGGVDNFFTNLDENHVKGENLGTGGSDHDALSATFQFLPQTPVQTQNVKPAKATCEDVQFDHDRSLTELFTIKYVDGGYLTLDATGMVSVNDPDPNTATRFKREQAPNWEVSYSSVDDRVLVPGKDNIVQATSVAQHAAQNWHQELNHDGTFVYKDIANQYIKVTNGVLSATTSNKSEASRFSVVSTTWMYPVNFVPDQDMCCTMCHMKWGCQTWSFTNVNTGLGGPWPGQCWLKGGGDLQAPEWKKGVSSGLPGQQHLR